MDRDAGAHRSYPFALVVGAGLLLLTLALGHADPVKPAKLAEPVESVDPKVVGDEACDGENKSLTCVLKRISTCADCPANESEDSDESNTIVTWLKYPSCAFRVLVDPCGPHWALSVPFMLLLAVLVRQCIVGYREADRRLLFALFLVALAGAFAFDQQASLDGHFPIILLVVFAVFVGGVLAFWAKYFLDLLPVAVGALAAGALSEAGYLNVPSVLLPWVIGVIGGLWLFWSRDRRQPAKQKPLPPSGPTGNGAQPTPPAPSPTDQDASPQTPAPSLDSGKMSAVSAKPADTKDSASAPKRKPADGGDDSI